MSDAQNIRRSLKILEGELLPPKPNTLRITSSNYELYRALLHLPCPENYTSPKPYGGIGVMHFWDDFSYEEAKKKLEKFGIKYEEEPTEMSTEWDEENFPETENIVSPYPSNNKIQQFFNDDKPYKTPTRDLPNRRRIRG